MAQTGIRAYLNDNGYTTDQIGYSNGNVLLNGKNFIAATPQAKDDPTLGLVKDRTYADPTALASALNSYRATDYNTKAAGLYDQYAGLATAKPEQVAAPSPFTYDAASDPEYQAALNLAKGNIQTSQNNTLANLVAHGQGDSSYSAGVTQQIADKEMANVSNVILPQLIEQAYKHYTDANDMNFKVNQENYNRGNDYTKNVGGVADVYNNLAGQQETQYSAIQDSLAKEAAAEEQARLGRLTLAKQLSEEYGVQVDPKMDPALVYKQVAGLTPLARKDTEFDQRIKQQGADATTKNSNTSAAGQGTSAARLAWDQNPDNPDNIYKSLQIDELKNPTPKPTTPVTAEEYDKNLVPEVDNKGNVTNAQQLEDQIILSGLSDWEQYKLYIKHKIPWTDPIPKKPS